MAQAVMFCATAVVGGATEKRPWEECKAVVDKVHRHVCGHSNFTDIKVLLERNGLWDAHVQKYLSGILESCEKCKTTALPKSSRKATLSSLSREFNKVVCVDHLFLDEYCVFHLMDSTTRFSVGAVVNSSNMLDAIEVFESSWLSQFWEPEVVAFDQAFNSDIFLKFLGKYGIEARPLPSRRHNKNVLESKHRIIRDVYIRLKADAEGDPTLSGRTLVQQALRISNDLYGNDVMSSQELAKGYTRPVESGNVPRIVPKEIREAHENLKAKRKLTLILRSKATTDEKYESGDMVQIYVKKGNEKRGKWSGDKIVLSYDESSRSVTVPGGRGKRIIAAVEDVRPAIQKDSFAKLVQESIDELEMSLDEVIQKSVSENSEEPEIEGAPEKNKRDYEVRFDLSQDNVMPHIGTRVEVYWPEEEKYYAGNVENFDPRY